MERAGLLGSNEEQKRNPAFPKPYLPEVFRRLDRLCFARKVTLLLERMLLPQNQTVRFCPSRVHMMGQLRTDGTGP